MRIGINALVFKNPLSGVGKRILSLYQKIHQINPQAVFYFFSPYPLSYSLDEYGIDFRKSSFRFITTQSPVLWRWVGKLPGIRDCMEWYWTQVRLPFLLSKYHIDIYDSQWGGGLPTLFPYRLFRSLFGDVEKPIMLTTIHDLIPLMHPQYLLSQKTLGMKIFAKYWHPIKNYFFRRRIQANLDLADQTFVVSNMVKTMLQQYFPRCIKRIRPILVSNNGVNLMVPDKNSINESLKNFQEQNNKNQKKFNRFLFYVGGFNPRKNLPLLIKGLNQIKSLEQDYGLVMAGPENTYFKKILKPLITTSTFPIVHVGYLSEKQLVFFYREAEMFIYPSLAEGFGIPPLEALACGTSVIIDRHLPLGNMLAEYAQRGYGVIEKSLAQVQENNLTMIDFTDEQEVVNTISRKMQSHLSPFKATNVFADTNNPFHWQQIATQYYATMVSLYCQHSNIKIL